MTIDHSRPEPEDRPTLPDFTPVPRLTSRHDGWTPARQQGFIEALADTGSVRAAAHAVNMTPEGAYLLRRHPQAESFRAAWEAALQLGVRRLEDVAMERALHGVEVPVYHFGAVVGTRRVYNDRLLMFLLRNRAADRFAADSRHSASQRSTLARLKREWRAEWAAEQTRDSDGALERINAKLTRMRERWWHNLSDRTRAAYEEYQRLEQEDKRLGHYRDDDDEDDAPEEDRP